MKLNSGMTAAALALFVAAVPAMAKSSKAKNKWSGRERAEINQQFARFDLNGDGVITPAEFPADASLFSGLDLNRDGLLTRSEVARAIPDRQSAERQIRAFDRNGDGVITRDEFPGDATAFTRLDRNGDGVLSQADHRGGKGKGKRKR